jgi:hypothetical protein
MQNDQQQTSLFSFIHPDHACLPLPVRAFFNTAATLIFLAPALMASTSCLGILLGLTGLQEAFPTLSQGIAQGLHNRIHGPFANGGFLRTRAARAAHPRGHVSHDRGTDHAYVSLGPRVYLHLHSVSSL